MRNTVFFLFLFFLSPQKGNANLNIKIDSLQILLENYQSEDAMKVDLLNNIGYEYWVVDPSKSVQFGNSALDLAQRLEYLAGIATAQRIIGVADWALGNYDESLTKLFPALENYGKLNDSLGLANILMNIGLVYADQKNYQEALKYYFQGEKIFKQRNQFSRLATTKTKIGAVYTELENYEKAFEYLTSSLAMHKESGFRYGVAEASNRLGLLFREKGDYENALNYLNSSLQMSIQINDFEGKSKTLENIGSIYLVQEDFVNAEIFLLRALKAAKEVQSKKWLKDIYLDLKILYQQKGEIDKALNYFELHSQMKDSLFDQKKLMEISAIRLKFEMDRQKKSIEIGKERIRLLEQKKRNGRLLIYLISSLLILAISIAYFIILRQKNKIKLEKKEQEEKEKLNKSREELNRAKLENAILQEKELQQKLELKNKELASYTINFIRKNELLDEIKQELVELEKDASADQTKIRRIKQKVSSNTNLDKDWQDFKTHFEQVHTGFFKNLKSKHPNLTSGDLKLSALIRMNLNLKESAAILGISPESVKTSRYRLRKKMNIPQSSDLLEYIIDAGTVHNEN
tara:strand:+ start:46006 stop:47730 length:1725 start_codon:yes stop_codon:yes gene_type:complete